jgi:hypothetical protein
MIIKIYKKHLNLYNETQLKNFGERIESINSYLKENNINFYYMNCYSPHTIYPENYSSNIYRIGETSLYNQIEKEIKNNTSVKFIDTYDKLIEGKKDHQVYSKRSDWTHWNQYGAYIAYTEMMKSISKDYPNINVLNLNDFNISFEDTKYSIYNSVDLIENKEMFNYKKGYSYIKDNAPIEQLGYKNNVYRLVNKT